MRTIPKPILFALYTIIHVRCVMQLRIVTVYGNVALFCFTILGNMLCVATYYQLTRVVSPISSTRCLGNAWCRNMNHCLNTCVEPSPRNHPSDRHFLIIIYIYIYITSQIAHYCCQVFLYFIFPKT